MSIQIALEQSALARFPDVQVRALLAEGLDRLSDPGGSHAPIDDAAAELAAHGPAVGDLAQHPAIRGWREAFKAQGLKPSDYPSSVEALARRALKQGPPRTGVPAVDLYNAASIRCLAPVGACDPDKLPRAEMALRAGQPETDRFEPLGGPSSRIKPSSEVIVYASGDTVLCWAFNFRDSAETALDAASVRGLFVSESVTHDQHDRSADALDWLAGAFAARGIECSGPRLLSQAEPRAELPPRSG
jgi:DNA/RNA-binding domain of Phe-tRNA-synthetase-like protein